MKKIIIGLMLVFSMLNAMVDSCGSSIVEYRMVMAATAFEDRVYHAVDPEIYTFAYDVMETAKHECADTYEEERATVGYNAKYIHRRMKYEVVMSYGPDSPAIPVKEIKRTCWNSFKLLTIMDKIATEGMNTPDVLLRARDVQYLEMLSHDTFMRCLKVDMDKANIAGDINAKWRRYD